MKTNILVGVLGGLGPEATCEFFKKIIKFSHAETDQEHLDLLIYNNPKVPDRTKAIMGLGESSVPELINGLQLLERSGVEFIVIPCISSHYFLKEMQESISIRIISAVSEIASYIHKTYREAKKVGVLATTGTIKGMVFDKVFENYSVTLITPNEQDQKTVMEIIYGIDGIKAGNLGNTPRKKLVEIGNHLISDGADVIIAGCTEIPLVLKENDLEVPIIDSLEVLAISTILAAGGRIRT